MQEIWKTIADSNGRYEVSNLGRVKSYMQDKVNGKIVGGHLNFKGYPTAMIICADGKRRLRPIHRLVAIAFIPNPDNLPQVNHKDEVKTNNRVDNLEWCTNEYNARYGTHFERAALANRNCRTTSVGVFSVDSDGNFVFYDSIGDAERKTGLPHSNIVRALKGRRPRCGGRCWFYSYEPPRYRQQRLSERTPSNR